MAHVRMGKQGMVVDMHAMRVHMPSCGLWHSVCEKEKQENRHLVASPSPPPLSPLPFQSFKFQFGTCLCVLGQWWNMTFLRIGIGLNCELN